MATNEDLFSEHISALMANAERSLEACKLDDLYISSGSYDLYFLDDRHITFVPTPHFVHWVPNAGIGHLVHISKGKKPKVYFHQPLNFWLETEKFDPSWYWVTSYEVEVHESQESIWKAASKNSQGKRAFIGAHTEDASKIGCEINPEALLNRLNWQRRIKSSYEVKMMEEAVSLAVKGHLAAADLFFKGASELEIYHEFQRVTMAVPETVPYEPIVAIDEKAAFLHYLEKRSQKIKSSVLLIDAGAKVKFYNSDITRTFLKPGTHPVFVELHQRLNKIQLLLCDQVKPQASYLEMQTMAMRLIAEALCDTKIIQVSAEEAFETKIVDRFLPHGLGHQLGIQVHDVGGRQASWEGTENDPSSRFPKLRSSTPLVKDQICTIEPGIYFIDHLLSEVENADKKLNQKLLKDMMLLGGMRIEDDVLITQNGHRNLSREAFKKLSQ